MCNLSVHNWTVLTTVMTLPRALDVADIMRKNTPQKFRYIKDHLNATITDSTLSALIPNTFLKNRAAAGPEFIISSFVAALRR